MQSNDLKVSTFKSLSANRTWLPHLRGIGHPVLPLLYDGKSQRIARELWETGNFHDVVHRSWRSLPNRRPRKHAR